MKLYTNVWVECSGVDGACPHRNTAHPAVELAKRMKKNGNYGEHYLIDEDSLAMKLKDVGWQKRAGIIVCPACAAACDF